MRKKDLLLVIDMQNVYTEGRQWACRDTAGAAGRLKRLIAAGACDEVIFTRFLPAKEPVGVWKDYNIQNREVNEDWDANRMMEAFSEELESYPLYTKSVYSSLEIPQVRKAAERADRVVVGGVVAECCVLATVMALIDAGIYTVYLTDGVSGLDGEKESAVEQVLSGLAPLHLTMQTTEEYLEERKIKKDNEKEMKNGKDF